MKTIGITGGVGAGKTQIMKYLKEHYCCSVLMADEIAHTIKEPGQPSYDLLVHLLGEEILQEDGRIHNGRMAACIFKNKKLLIQVNAILHPAVKQWIQNRIKEEQKNNRIDFLFLEAALLIEEKYEELLDEIWYIYVDEESRKKRLKQTRGYEEEKIEQIFESQLSESDFRKHCKVVIDNSKKIEDTYKQIDKKLEEYL